ncbi:MAG: glycosyltransferase family 4 protein [Flavobacteriales bacterium]|nr:glycosyltransferase family 4 protein [Flavobacteriales bacterium]
MKSVDHILFVVPGFPADENDTTCVPGVQDLVFGLQQAAPGVRHSVITLQYPYTREPYDWHGIRVYPCGGEDRRFPFRLMAWAQAGRYFRSMPKLTLIHSMWLTEAAWLASRWSKRHGIPHVCTMMGQDALPSNAYLKLPGMRSVHCVALCNRQDQAFANTTGRRADAVIPIAHHIQLSEGGMERDVDVLGVGSLVPGKAFGDFVDVVGTLIAGHPNLRAVILGDGPERSMLMRKINDAGLQKNIVLAGQVPRDEVIRWMKRSKVLLQPSLYEGFGMVPFEALSQGMRVVTRPVGDNAVGDHWHVGNTCPELADAVQAFLQMPPRTSGNIVHSVASMVESYGREYERLSRKSLVVSH